TMMRGAIARVRQQARVGWLADAFSDESFCRAVIEAIGAERELPAMGGVIRFRATRALPRDALPLDPRIPVRQPSVQSTNTTVAIGEQMFLKGYRRLRTGINMELEVGRYLTEV